MGSRFISPRSLRLPIVMKNYLLVLALFTCASSTSQAQHRPKIKSRHAFTHSSEASEGKHSKARFRCESSVPVIDLNPRSMGKSEMVKAPKPYKYSKGI